MSIPPAPNEMTAWPLISPVTIGPGPVPTQIAVGEARNAITRLVVLQLTTPLGVQMFFIEPELAVKLGKQLSAFGSGIVTAGEPQIITIGS